MAKVRFRCLELIKVNKYPFSSQPAFCFSIIKITETRSFIKLASLIEDGEKDGIADNNSKSKSKSNSNSNSNKC